MLTRGAGQPEKRGTMVDVVIIGAGAAGVAAGRVLAARNIPFVILEASPRIGGRAYTDRASLPGHWDQGAQWFHCADVNPLVPEADALGWQVEKKDRINWSMNFRQGTPLGQAEDAVFEAELGAAFDAVYAASRGGQDVPVADVLPPTRFGPEVRSVFQLMISEDAEKTSALGYGDYDDTEVNWVVTGGMGALVERLATGLPIRTGVAVTSVTAQQGGRVRVETTGGAIEAKAAIVTVSTNVLLSGAIGFGTESAQVLELMQDLPCGTYEKVALAFDRLPFDPAERLFLNLVGAEAEPVLGFQIVEGPHPKLIAHFGGLAARQMLALGTEGMIDYARKGLAATFGSEAGRSIRAAAVTGWQANPWVQGAYSYARVGGGRARKAMIAANQGEVRFAGEAFSPQWHSTVHGAWDTGRAAAQEIAAILQAGKRF